MTEVPWIEAFRDRQPIAAWGGRPITTVQAQTYGDFHLSTFGPFGRIFLPADGTIEVLE